MDAGNREPAQPPIVGQKQIGTGLCCGGQMNGVRSGNLVIDDHLLELPFQVRMLMTIIGDHYTSRIALQRLGSPMLTWIGSMQAVEVLALVANECFAAAQIGERSFPNSAQRFEGHHINFLGSDGSTRSFFAIARAA